MKLKLKYFIRGFGIGIIFTAIIMSISLQASRSKIIKDNALTKEEIMEKAMGYGMVMESTEDVKGDESQQEDQNQEDNQDIKNQDEVQHVDNPKDDSSKEDDTSQNEVNNDSQNDDNVDLPNKESDDTQDSANKETNENDSKEDESNDNDSKKNNNLVVSIDYIPIEITTGMTATSVGKLLKEKGVIEDPDEFRRYMSENGYSGRIRTGNYLIPVDATYKKIADIIAGKRK
ncbi:hypothetical protein [Anaerosporobacter sp.]|uniref:hypothetical protein n=1 Tax=Anaerosporobacter sp. TaxID=1872529 RepID=UPI00286F0D5D|nr:hypothetical protein [Anaerosporobacter sp.]